MVIMKGLVKSGYCSKSFEHSRSRSFLKTLSRASFQINISSFFNKFVKGLAILEKFGINRL